MPALFRPRSSRRTAAGVLTAAVAATLAMALIAGASPAGTLLGLAAAALIAALVIWVVIRAQQRESASLAEAIGEIAAGRFAEIPADRGPDAAAGFNAMSRALADREQTRERSHAALQQNTELLETVLGTMVEGVLVVDREERLLYANDAARQMLEVPGRALTGRPIYEISRSTGLRDAIQGALANGPCQRELEVPRVGRLLSLSAAALPGEPVPGAVVVLHDVTSLRRLEKMRSEFASNVSHELKTPLTSIQAYADTLLEGALDEPDTARQFLERIVEQTERLRTLILDLISLSKIESQQEAYDIQPVNAAQVARESVAAQREVAEGQRIDLTLADSPADMIVLVDAEGLRTMLDNLVNNAINYTPAGGRVAVRWSVEGEFGRIDVADTGVGIPREHLPRIFERFYRVDKARSRLVGGTGLGLAIVKHLVHVFDGRIDVDSTPGKGSTFTIRIPLARTATASL